MRTRIKLKKGLIAKSKRWYCNICDKTTKSIELRNKKYGYLSGMKCLCCNTKNYLSDSNCPKCGAESDTWEMECTFIGDCGKDSCKNCEFEKAVSKTLVELSKATYNYSASMDYGSCYDWTETHKCWNCRTVYEFSNSSC